MGAANSPSGVDVVVDAILELWRVCGRTAQGLCCSACLPEERSRLSAVVSELDRDASSADSHPAAAAGRRQAALGGANSLRVAAQQGAIAHSLERRVSAQMSRVMEWSRRNPHQADCSLLSDDGDGLHQDWLSLPGAFTARRLLQDCLLGFGRVDPFNCRVLLFTESQWRQLASREEDGLRAEERALATADWGRIGCAVNALFPFRREADGSMDGDECERRRMNPSEGLEVLREQEDGVLQCLLPFFAPALVAVDPPQPSPRRDSKFSVFSSDTEYTAVAGGTANGLLALLLQRASKSWRVCCALFWALHVASQAHVECSSVVGLPTPRSCPSSPHSFALADPRADFPAAPAVTGSTDSGAQAADLLRTCGVGHAQALARQWRVLIAMRELRHQSQRRKHSLSELAWHGYCGLALAFDADTETANSPPSAGSPWCGPQVYRRNDGSRGRRAAVPGGWASPASSQESPSRAFVLPPGSSRGHPVPLAPEPPWVGDVLSRPLQRSPVGQWEHCATIPVAPDDELVGVMPHTLKCFATANTPLHCEFGSLTGRNRSAIYKDKDDLRRDQTVLSICSIVHHMWLQNGLDLRLTVYPVVPTSPSDGFVGMVPSVVSVGSLLSAGGRPLKELLDGQPGTEPELVRARERRLDNWVRSNAGYAVLTYVLGLGDRHLDNLLVTEDGRLVHIDFGFILGRDPKPGAPPLKLREEMVHAMGGPDSDEFQRMQDLCVSGYLLLRKCWHVCRTLLRLASEVRVVKKGRLVHALTGDDSWAQMENRLAEADRRLCLHCSDHVASLRGTKKTEEKKKEVKKTPPFFHST
eukprot:TRINITY_DN8628_c0_g1_i2.p1 TRINITY_DN8628_c0_g1~~TRINITY_DN8628_c0_g1_i2.p1  ORF type:complete len:869 (+),score=283.29 TRINITY_DN8628_c0_g1_i2:164-2608(+)